VTREYRPEFLAALDLLAKASTLMVAEGHAPPVLVGGAVVEFETRSAMTSGDLDLVSASDRALARALEAVGFRKEDRPGQRLGGWFHPDLPIAVDCVASRYYEGRGDRSRIRIVEMPSGDVLMAPIEELIIDRIGQWEASDRKDRELRAQVAGLLELAEELDETYVLRRVHEENGLIPDLDMLRHGDWAGPER
jgi:hypothetical protein